MTNWDAVKTGSLDALMAAIMERMSDQRDDPSSREQEYADTSLSLIERCKAAERALAESEARRAEAEGRVAGHLAARLAMREEADRSRAERDDMKAERDAALRRAEAAEQERDGAGEAVARLQAQILAGDALCPTCQGHGTMGTGHPDSTGEAEEFGPCSDCHQGFIPDAGRRVLAAERSLADAEQTARNACGWPDHGTPSEGRTWVEELAGFLRVTQSQRNDAWGREAALEAKESRTRAFLVQERARVDGARAFLAAAVEVLRQADKKRHGSCWFCGRMPGEGHGDSCALGAVLGGGR